jgi:hypothetical protein
MSVREKIEMLQQPVPADFNFIRAPVVHLVREYRPKIIPEKGTRA